MPLLVDDPIDLELDSEGDLIFPLRHCSGLTAVRQGIRIRLLIIRGEWFMNLDEGIPYLEGDGIPPELVILGGAFNREVTEGLMRQAILKVKGVKSIVSLDMTFDGPTRVLTIRFQVQTEFGDTVEDTLEVTP